MAEKLNNVLSGNTGVSLALVFTVAGLIASLAFGLGRQSAIMSTMLSCEEASSIYLPRTEYEKNHNSLKGEVAQLRLLAWDNKLMLTAIATKLEVKLPAGAMSPMGSAASRIPEPDGQQAR